MRFTLEWYRLDPCNSIIHSTWKVESGMWTSTFYFPSTTKNEKSNISVHTPLSTFLSQWIIELTVGTRTRLDDARRVVCRLLAKCWWRHQAANDATRYRSVLRSDRTRQNVLPRSIRRSSSRHDRSVWQALRGAGRHRRNERSGSTSQLNAYLISCTWHR